MSFYFVLFILCLKLLLAATFSSDLMDKIFLPFCTHFVQHFDNPWQAFYQQHSALSFPYNPLMLYLLSPFAYLAQLLPASAAATIGRNLLLKAPTMLSDLIIFKTLCHQWPDKKKEIFFYYLCSPMILYSCYAHAQLDLIPTAFIFLTVHFLNKAKHYPSAFFLGAALSTKVHTLIALPFILTFLYKNNKNKNQYATLKYVGVALLTALGLCSPFIFSEGFVHAILHNKEKNLMFDVFYQLGDLHIYLAPLALTVIFLKFLTYKKINKDLLNSFLAMAFSLFVLLVVPTPGWYIWGLPFILSFFIRMHEKRPELSLIYIILNVFFLIYFIGLYHHPLQHYANLIFLGYEIWPQWSQHQLLKNLFFTALEAVMATVIYFSYSYGVRSNSVYKGRNAPVLIGIGGDSAAGKSTLLSYLMKLLGSQDVVVLEGDAEHKWERGHEMWKTLTHLNPKANHLHRQLAHLEMLKHGHSTMRSDYDHTSGQFTMPQKIAPGNFIILSGLHPFYLPKTRHLIDLKIFLDTDPQLRLHWKILRDVQERGHSKEKVLQQIQAREDDAQKYILPQQNFADLVFNFFTNDDFEVGDIGAQFELKLRIYCNANVNLDVFFEEASLCSMVNLDHDYTTDLKRQVITFSGDISEELLQKISLKSINNQEEFLAQEVQWMQGMAGVMQLFVLLNLAELFRGEQNDRSFLFHA